MSYVIKQKRRTCCPCNQRAADVSPGAALRAAGFFAPLPQMRHACAPVQPRVPEPFYDGPCGTEVEIPGCCQSSDFYPTYAYFSQFAPLTQEAGEAIPFSGDFHLSPTGVRTEGDMLLLAQPGTYAISYMVDLPAGAAFDTVFSLLVNGTAVPGMTISAYQSAEAEGKQIFAQAIITTDRTAQLELISSEALSVEGEDIFATLTLHRIA